MEDRRLEAFMGLLNALVMEAYQKALSLKKEYGNIREEEVWDEFKRGVRSNLEDLLSIL